MEEKKIPPIEKAYFKTNTLKSIYSTCPAKMTNGHIGWTLPVDKPLLGSLSSDHDNGSKDVAELKNWICVFSSAQIVKGRRFFLELNS